MRARRKAGATDVFPMPIPPVRPMIFKSAPSFPMTAGGDRWGEQIRRDEAPQRLVYLRFEPEPCFETGNALMQQHPQSFNRGEAVVAGGAEQWRPQRRVDNVGDRHFWIGSRQVKAQPVAPFHAKQSGVDDQGVIRDRSVALLPRHDRETW